MKCHSSSSPETFSANNFALSDSEGNTSRWLNRRAIADLPLLRTLLAICQKSREPSFWEMMESFFSSICKFDVFKKPFTTITSLLELYVWFRRFILLLQTKKAISMSYGSSASSWKQWRWVRFDLILTVRDIYSNSSLNRPTKFTSKGKSTEVKDILPWNISQIIMKIIPISRRIVASCCECIGKSMETETTTWSKFPNGGKAIVEQILVSEEINKSVRAGLWESQSGIPVEKLTMWVRSFEIEKL